MVALRTIKKQKVVDASAEPTFCICMVQDPSLRNDTAHMYGGYSHLNSPHGENPSQSCTETHLDSPSKACM